MNYTFTPYEGSEKYIFVSYSHDDIKIVVPIINMLAHKGFRIWYDKGIHVGNEHQEEIAEHVKDCEVLVAFLSQKSIQSEYCKDEIHYAKTYGKRIISIFLEKIDLSPGLEMNLLRIQAINYYDYKDDLEKFYAALIGENNINILLLCRDDDTKSDSEDNYAVKSHAASHEVISHVKNFLHEHKLSISCLLTGAVIVFAIWTWRYGFGESYLAPKPFSGFEVASHGTEGQIRRGIVRGADFNFMDDKGNTALYFAAMNNTHPEAVKLLIEQTNKLSSDVRQKRLNEALIYAAKSNPNPEVIKTLLEAGANTAYSHQDYVTTSLTYATALFYSAAKNPNLEVMKLLLDSENSIRRELIMQGFILTGRGESLLECALWNLNIEIPRFLIKSGANVQLRDTGGRTLLMKGIIPGGIAPIKLLAEAGLDVNSQDNNGKTALMYAAEYSEPFKRIQELIACGADVNIQDNNGRTALMYIAQNSWAQFYMDKKLDDSIGGTKQADSSMQFILNAGADVNIQDNEGKTALMYAAKKKLPGRVRILLDAGAKADLTDKHGREAIDFIAWTFVDDHEKNEIIRMLLEAGADDKSGRYKVNVFSKKPQTQKVSKDYDLSALAEKGTARQIQEAINAGCKFNKNLLRNASFRNSNPESLLLLVQHMGIHDNFFTVLHNATLHNPNSEVIEALIEAYFYLGETAVSRLKERRMDTLFSSAMFNPAPEVIKTILRLLFTEQEVSMLLKGTMLYDGFTLLGRSAIRNKINVIQAIIDLGADVNARCEDGRTALMIAASGYYTNKGRVELFINAGADTTLKDDKGKFALDYAKENISIDYADREEIISLLTNEIKKTLTDHCADA
ncbi:MAG: ankyrin repeat domain-containing protein [Synergistaceae bacterium]|nr:ankyrin repeat domain-containing protein [Synergistaceae bacterium]